MDCALCLKKKADKKNTHYLTDFIIRSALNLGGSNDRERGFYVNQSTGDPFIDFNFQRNTPAERVEKELDRIPNDDEIEKAKQNPYSVDNVFCSDCEKLFTQIENSFSQNIIPRFRETDLEGIIEVEIIENREMRLFIYLQVWRSAICEEIFDLSDETLETLRSTILNSKNLSDEDFPTYPLHLTYLETREQEDYSLNSVGFTDDRNPNIIIMNDFVIQFFESEDSVQQLDFFGLNDYHEFTEFVNLNGDRFKVRVKSDEERKSFYFKTRFPKAMELNNYIHMLFKKTWEKLSGERPDIIDFQKFLIHKKSNKLVPNLKFFSKEEIDKRVIDYVKKELGFPPS